MAISSPTLSLTVASVATSPSRVGLDVDAKVQPLEVRAERAGTLLDQQIERRLGRLELIALILQSPRPAPRILSISFASSCKWCFVVMAMMFERPDSSLIRTRRSLPTTSGAMCS